MSIDEYVASLPADQAAVADVTDGTEDLTASADGTRWSLKIPGPDDVDEAALDGWLKQLA